MAAGRAMLRRSAGHRYGSTQLERPTADPLVYPDRLLGGSVQQLGGRKLTVTSAQLKSLQPTIPPNRPNHRFRDTCSTDSGAPQSNPAHAAARAHSSTRLAPI